MVHITKPGVFIIGVTSWALGAELVTQVTQDIPAWIGLLIGALSFIGGIMLTTWNAAAFKGSLTAELKNIVDGQKQIYEHIDSSIERLDNRLDKMDIRLFNAEKLLYRIQGSREHYDKEEEG